jgi:predicted dehydrogenase
MSITVGVIGCGNISRFHFAGLEKAGARVKWVCDVAETAARPWADKFGARYTADYREVVGDADVQAVFILTFSSLHREQCLAAILAGKAVVCEKTLAVSAEEAIEITEAALAAGTIFYTSYMKRFIPTVAKAKELLPTLGRIVSTHIRAYQCWGDLWTHAPTEGFAWTPPNGQSVIRRNYGGGILVCGGSHILDLVGFLLGRPHRLYATQFIPEGRDYDLQAAALLETANGIVHYEALAHPLHRIGFLRDGWDERLEINGLHGRLEVFSAQWDNPYNKASLLVHSDNASGNTTEYRFDAVSPFERAVAFFCANIAAEQQGSQSPLTGYEVDELIAHIGASAEAGEALTVNWRL